MASRDIVWLSTAATAIERLIAGRYGEAPVTLHVPTSGGESYRSLFADTDPETYRLFYEVAANPRLWFELHSMGHLLGPLTVGEAAAGDAYRTVNTQIAGAANAYLTRINTARPVVLIQDYHFLLVAGQVRQAHPDAVLQLFMHIPFPRPDTLLRADAMGRQRVAELIEGMIANDIVGFQTDMDAENFLRTARDLGHRVDFVNRTIAADGNRRTWVRHNPAPASPGRLRALAAREEVDPHRDRLARLRAQGLEHLIVRVDRADPSKNVPLAFRAFERLLDKHPELAHTILFSAILPESRAGIPAYRAEIEAIKQTVRRINERWGDGPGFGPVTDMGAGWRPIEISFEVKLDDARIPVIDPQTAPYEQLGSNSDLMVALYEGYDVQVTNSVSDGMHLGAKEAPLLNKNRGVSILSHTLGAFAELAQSARGVDAQDEAGLARAMWQVLRMAPAERARRLAAAKHVATARGNLDWFNEQLADIALVLARGDGETTEVGPADRSPPPPDPSANRRDEARAAWQRLQEESVEIAWLDVVGLEAALHDARLRRGDADIVDRMSRFLTALRQRAPPQLHQADRGHVEAAGKQALHELRRIDLAEYTRRRIAFLESELEVLAADEQEIRNVRHRLKVTTERLGRAMRARSFDPNPVIAMRWWPAARHRRTAIRATVAAGQLARHRARPVDERDADELAELRRRDTGYRRAMVDWLLLQRTAEYIDELEMAQYGRRPPPAPPQPVLAPVEPASAGRWLSPLDAWRLITGAWVQGADADPRQRGFTIAQIRRGELTAQLTGASPFYELAVRGPAAGSDPYWHHVLTTSRALGLLSCDEFGGEAYWRPAIEIREQLGRLHPVDRITVLANPVAALGAGIAALADERPHDDRNQLAGAMIELRHTLAAVGRGEPASRPRAPPAAVGAEPLTVLELGAWVGAAQRIDHRATERSDGLTAAQLAEGDVNWDALHGDLREVGRRVLALRWTGAQLRPWLEHLVRSDTTARLDDRYGTAFGELLDRAPPEVVAEFLDPGRPLPVERLAFGARLDGDPVATRPGPELLREAAAAREAHLLARLRSAGGPTPRSGTADVSVPEAAPLTYRRRGRLRHGLSGRPGAAPRHGRRLSAPAAWIRARARGPPR